MLADLGENGALEQDSDIVAFIYRDDTYNTDKGMPRSSWPSTATVRRPRSVWPSSST
jgi:replicative DNA helicase